MTITGVALSGASIGANSMAQSRIASARSAAMAAENQRQQGYQAEATALNDKSRGRYDDFATKQDATRSGLAQQFAGANSSAPNPALTPKSSSDIVNKETEKQAAGAKAYGTQQGDALANLRSFGDTLATAGRGQARDAMGVSQIGGFMRGSSAVLPYELDAANSKGNGLKLFGDILGAGGQILTSAGLRGGGITANPLKAAPVSYNGAPLAYGSIY